MPNYKTINAATYSKEILRHVSGNEIAENAVVDGTQVPLNADGRRILEAGTVMVYTGVSEVQTVTITGSPTGGSFTLSFGGSTTANIAYNATAADVRAALEALPTIGDGNVSVTGGPGPGTPFTVTFQGALAARDVAQMTTANSFTGGSGPASAVTTATAGGSSQAIGQKVRPAAASGASSASLAGIVMATLELWPGTVEANKDDAALALYTKNCHFEASQLVGYSGNAAAVKTAMTGAGNDRCANCTFEA